MFCIAGNLVAVPEPAENWQQRRTAGFKSKKLRSHALRTAPYVDAGTSTHGDVQHRTLMSDTADAKCYLPLLSMGIQ